MAHDDRIRDIDASATGALVHAKDLKDFKLPEGRPDPRGWDVLLADGTKVGKVEDLLVDTSSRQVRYLEFDVADAVVKAGGREYALVPIGAARLDDDRDDVIVNLSLADLRDVPLYDRRELSRDYEQRLHEFLDERPHAARRDAETTRSVERPVVAADRAADFYANPYYDEKSFFARRAAAPTAGAADRATTSGLADRVADAADNVKDRIDGNPASRPGPDPTDRQIGRR